MKFTVNIHDQQADFLDLHIFMDGDKLRTKIHFKTTDRNGYIPVGSCHHPQWKTANPKCHIRMRIRRKCSALKDYVDQTNVLIQRFLDKGYPHARLLKVRDSVGRMNRETLLESKHKEVATRDITFITGFNKQYKHLEKSIKKYWPILQKDPTLNQILQSRPKFIYRRVENQISKKYS